MTHSPKVINPHPVPRSLFDQATNSLGSAHYQYPVRGNAIFGELHVENVERDGTEQGVSKHGTDPQKS